MNKLTKQAWVVLPVLVAMSIGGWLVFGTWMGRAGADDLLAWLSGLPIASAWALAVLVAAMLAMRVTGMDVPNDTRQDLLHRAANGDAAAYCILRLESICWFAMIALSAAVFWMVRR